jgi:hypothetical protein
VNKAKSTPFAALVATPVMFPSPTPIAPTLRLAVGVNSSAKASPGKISQPAVGLYVLPAPTLAQSVPVIARYSSRHCGDVSHDDFDQVVFDCGVRASSDHLLRG